MSIEETHDLAQHIAMKFELDLQKVIQVINEYFECNRERTPTPIPENLFQLKRTLKISDLRILEEIEK